MASNQTENLTVRQRQERAGILLTCLMGTVLLYMSFLLSYHLIHDLKSSDFIRHISFMNDRRALEIVYENLTGNDMLWHLAVKTVSHLGGTGDMYAACTVNAVSIVSVYAIACVWLSRELKAIHRALIPLAAFVSCVVGPLYLPWFNEEIYLGQGSPNIWHNPTHLAIRPIAMLSFWMTVTIYNRLRQDGEWPAKAFRSKGEAALYAGLLALGIMAKPSYFQIAVPALGILMIVDLIRSKGKAFPFCLKLAVAHIPAALLTGATFFRSFYAKGSGGEGIEIAFLDVWKHNSSNVLLSILLLYAFPLFVLIVGRRHIFKRVEGQFSLALVFTGGMMKALLAEKGSRRYAGNFGWGWGIASALVWFQALKEFIRLMTGQDELSQREYKIAAYGGWILLSLHLLTGIVYFCHLMTGTKQC